MPALWKQRTHPHVELIYRLIFPVSSELIKVPPCCPLPWGGSRGPTLKRWRYLQLPFLPIRHLLSSLAALAEQPRWFPRPALLGLSGTGALPAAKGWPGGTWHCAGARCRWPGLGGHIWL